jgi:hypothetical protein
MIPAPRRPSKMPKHGEVCLRALVTNRLADRISLGGAFGLLHYLDYRTTRDIDAWWSASAGAKDRARVVETIQEALLSFGTVRTRAWGDVVSVELEDKEGETFSFQIAERTVALEAPLRADWIDVPLDTFPDLLGSKMAALVERGAPRDFRDIFAVCQAGLATASECWLIWTRRQRAGGSDADLSRARLAIESHLSRIAAHRPLDQIPQAEARAQAERLRDWFIRAFLEAIP